MCSEVFCVNGTATTEIYTCGHRLSRHDALPIGGRRRDGGRNGQIASARGFAATLRRAWAAPPPKRPDRPPAGRRQRAAGAIRLGGGARLPRSTVPATTTVRTPPEATLRSEDRRVG